MSDGETGDMNFWGTEVIQAPKRSINENFREINVLKSFRKPWW
jgi:hypothetical protein